MKNFRSISLLAAVLAFALSASAHDYSATGTSSIGAVSNTSATSYAGIGGGLSVSSANNSQFATAGTTASGSAGQLLGIQRWTGVELSGAVTTGGVSQASNASLGNATGAASAGGAATANVSGIGAGHTVANGPTVSASGDASAVTATGATAGRNGLAITGGLASAGFSAGASASSLTLGPIKTGDVDSHSSTLAATTPSLTLVVGNAGITIQNEAAANALSHAQVGALQSSN